jgi:hypothetical protein
LSKRNFVFQPAAINVAPYHDNFFFQAFVDTVKQGSHTAADDVSDSRGWQPVPASATTYAEATTSTRIIKHDTENHNERLRLSVNHLDNSKRLSLQQQTIRQSRNSNDCEDNDGDDVNDSCRLSPKIEASDYGSRTANSLVRNSLNEDVKNKEKNDR